MCCRLCGKDYHVLSDEHYPAKSVGNNDLVMIDLEKLIASGLYVMGKTEEEKNNYFEKEVVVHSLPDGRTAKTLCQSCNRFLGKYDEAYKKFFCADGNPAIVKGYQRQTKINIIKSIYGKFLSVPEARKERFDFIDFLRNSSNDQYTGQWQIYFMKRNPQERALGLTDYSTNMSNFPDGVVYEMCDEKFIFDMMNFEKHLQYTMNNIFDILNTYKLVEYDGGLNSYHGQFVAFGGHREKIVL